MFKSEMLGRREYLFICFANLSHRRYLPVKVPAADSDGKDIHLDLPTGVRLHISVLIRELNLSNFGPEVIRHVRELLKTWKVKRESD